MTPRTVGLDGRGARRAALEQAPPRPRGAARLPDGRPLALAVDVPGHASGWGVLTIDLEARRVAGPPRALARGPGSLTAPPDGAWRAVGGVLGPFERIDTATPLASDAPPDAVRGRPGAPRAGR